MRSCVRKLFDVRKTNLVVEAIDAEVSRCLKVLTRLGALSKKRLDGWFFLMLEIKNPMKKVWVSRKPICMIPKSKTTPRSRKINEGKSMLT